MLTTLHTIFTQLNIFFTMYCTFKCKAAVTSLCLNHGVLSAAVGRNVRLMDARGGNLVMKAVSYTGYRTVAISSSCTCTCTLYMFM